jgi:deoxycytidylate deaminase
MGIATIPIAVGQTSINEIDMTNMPTLQDRVTEELVFAVVGPIGSGCSSTIELLKLIMENDYGYVTTVYKLSTLIEDNLKVLNLTKPLLVSDADRVEFLQKAGDQLRLKFSNDYIVAKCIEKIAEFREKEGLGKTSEGSSVPIKIRHVHLIDSIKHPEELATLRRTYGDIFWQIGVFAPKDVRSQRLKFYKQMDDVSIVRITNTDYMEVEKNGQKVRDVFYQSDFFIRNDQDNKLKLSETIKRFLSILFGEPVHTPTAEESAMHTAYSEASKSACLSRQVGAAIVAENSELIGQGRNDVPKFNGGLYSENDSPNDHRCHAWSDKGCHNDRKKEQLYQQIFEKLTSKKLLTDIATVESIIESLKGTEIKSLIEFSRAVHAEMDAITSVARGHKAGIIGSTLYSTTFPCHSCARHIVASGIVRVYFIEPYPKSLAIELHMDAVSENESDSGKKVVFLQYSGIAPKNIHKLFRAQLTRKDDNGKLIAFDRKSAIPVVRVSLDDYSTHEKWVVAKLIQNEKENL